MKITKRLTAFVLAFVLAASFFPATAMANTANIPISGIGEDLCVTPDGKTFYSYQGKKLIKFDESGTVLETSITSIGEYDHPHLAINPSGVVVKSNYNSNYLYFYDGGLGKGPTDTTFNDLPKGGSTSEIPEIRGFSYDSTGKFIYLATKFFIYKVDASSYKVVEKLDIYENATKEVPNDIGVDRAGNIYIIAQNSSTASLSFSYIYKRDAASGEWGKVYLGGGILSGSFPHSIEVDHVGNVYAGFRNTGIFKFSPTSADGQTYKTSFVASPGGYYEGITKDAAGNIYYATKLNLNNYGVYKIPYTKTPVNGVTLSSSELTMGINDQQQLTAGVTPYTAEDKSVTWKSSNTGIATVDATGKVTAKKAGKATITATTTEGGKTAKCAITVQAAADPVEDPANDPGDDPADSPADDPADNPADNPGDNPADDPADELIDISKAKLTIASMSWTGKQRKPTKFTYNGKSYSIKANATVKYGTNKNIGKGTVKLTGKGKFTGTKTVTFKILPKKTAIVKSVTGKKSLKLTWKKLSPTQKITKYQIRYKVKGTSVWKTKIITAKSKPAGNISATIKGLKKGKQYQVQVRSYKVVNKVKYFSAWSAIKTTARIR